MFKGYDFVYDGKSSISENLKLLYFDKNADGEIKGIPDKNISIFKTNQSSKWKVSGVTMDEPYSFEIEIMFHGDGESEYAKRNPTLKRNLISKFSHWLFNQTTFKKLQILDDNLQDLYYMAIFKDVSYIEQNGEIIGFKATVICDCSGAYEDKTITKQCSVITSFNIQCLQDGIYDVRPIYKIKLDGTSVSITVNDKTINLKNLTKDSTVTIDTNTLITTSSADDNLYIGNRFNKIFPTLRYGRNNIMVAGNCELTISYSLVREVGA